MEALVAELEDVKRQLKECAAQYAAELKKDPSQRDADFIAHVRSLEAEKGRLQEKELVLLRKEQQAAPPSNVDMRHLEDKINTLMTTMRLATLPKYRLPKMPHSAPKSTSSSASSISSSSSSALLRDTGYKCTLQASYNMGVHDCMVMRTAHFPASCIVGAHIWPVAKAAECQQLLGIPVNHQKNGLLWNSALETAWSHCGIAIGVDGDTFRLIVLDSNWYTATLALNFKGIPPTDVKQFQAAVGSTTFGDLQGAELRFGNSLRPFKRSCIAEGQDRLTQVRANGTLEPSAELSWLAVQRISDCDTRSRLEVWLKALPAPPPPVEGDAESTQAPGTEQSAAGVPHVRTPTGSVASAGGAASTSACSEATASTPTSPMHAVPLHAVASTVLPEAVGSSTKRMLNPSAVAFKP